MMQSNSISRYILALLLFSLFFSSLSEAHHGEMWPDCPDVEVLGEATAEFSNISHNQYIELAEGQTSFTVTAEATVSGYCEIWAHDRTGVCAPIYTEYADINSFLMWENTEGDYRLRAGDSTTHGQFITLSRDFSDGEHHLVLSTLARETLCEVIEPNPVQESATFYINTVPPRENLGCSANDDGNQHIGNPCNAANGNKYQRELDAGSSMRGMAIERHYNSLMTEDYGLGVGWTASFTKKLVLGINLIHARRENGSRESFVYSNNTWKSGEDGTLSISQDATGYTLYLSDGGTERYDLQGRIQSESNNGYRLTYSYNAEGQLQSVTNGFGHHMAFAYDSNGHINQITLPDNATYQYSYDVNSHLISVIFPDSTNRAYHYENIDFPNALTGITDENGVRYATFGYNSKGWANLTQHAVTSNGDPQQKHELLYYYYDGRKVEVIDPLGQLRELNFKKYNGVKKLTRVTWPDEKYMALTYDTRGNVTSRTDEEGHITKYSYNEHNQKVNITQAVGTPVARLTSYSYLSSSVDLLTRISRPSVLNGSQYTTTITYDSNLNIDVVTHNGYRPDGTPISRSINYDFNSLGQLVRIDGPRTDVSDITHFDYYVCNTGSMCGQLKSVVNALGQTTTYDLYDAAGRLLKMTMPTGLVRELSYDARGLIRTITETPIAGSSQVTVYTYYPTGQLKTLTSPSGTVITHVYDNAHDLRQISDNLGNKIEYGYDLAGNRTSENIFDPLGQLQRAYNVSYDLHNHVASVMEVGQVTHYVYDALGNLTQSTDANNNITSHSYDALNRLTLTTDPLLNSSSYQFDAGDRITQVSAPNGAITQYSNDDFGNLLQEVSGDRGTLTYVYDVAGNRLSRQDGKGIVANYTYDGLNRLISTIYPSAPSEDIHYLYDSTLVDSNGIGRLTSIQKASGDINYSYDAWGNILSEEQTINGSLYTTRHRYDADNRLTQIVYPSGRVVNYLRNSVGRVSAVTTQAEGSEPVETLANVTNKPFGPVSQLQLGNNYNLNLAYDSAYRMVSAMGERSSNVLHDWQYGYDPVGNISSYHDLQNQADNQLFGYDKLNRLTSASGNYPSKAYQYDANGNRLQLTEAGQNSSYSYGAASNRLTGIADSVEDWAFSYDDNGQVTARTLQNDAGFSFSYSDASRLSEVRERVYDIGSGTVDEYLRYSLSYNGLGQRVHKNTENGSKSFVFDHRGKLLAEFDDSGEASKEYFYLEERPLAFSESKTVVIPPPQPADITIDNVDSNVAQTGNWVSKHSGEAYGSEQLVASGGTSSLFSWLPEVGAGDYEVYAWWGSKKQYSSNVPYAINHSSQQSIVNVDQSRDGGQWHLLGTFSFIGDGSETIAISDTNGQTSADAVRLLEVVGGPTIQTEKATYFIHADHLGTPRYLTNQAGQTVWQARYEPFGQVSLNEDVDGDGNDVVFNMRFPGQYFDVESRLHYNYYRFYEPFTGRYITSDPIGLDGGLNTYAYVEGNPVNYIDPLGLATYSCKRPLGGKPGSFTPPVFNHQYGCVGGSPNNMTCNSSTASDGDAIDNVWPFGNGSPGMPTSPSDDYYDSNSCEEVLGDDSCVESCIKTEWSSPRRPWYAVGYGGTDCQEYTNDIIDKCMKLCQRK